MIRRGILLLTLALAASAAQVGLSLNDSNEISSEESEEVVYKNTSCPCGIVNQVVMSWVDELEEFDTAIVQLAVQLWVGFEDGRWRENIPSSVLSKNKKFIQYGKQIGIDRYFPVSRIVTENRQRIINGIETSEGKFPFMVSIRNAAGLHFCGASVITPIHILTAAHCVSSSAEKTKPNSSDLIVVAGAHHIMDDSSHGETQRMAVKTVVIPTDWFKVKKSLANDIAVLVLEKPLKYSKYVSPVCLSPEEPNLVNVFVKAMGWGLTELNKLPDRLLEADVQVLDKSQCNNNPKEVCFKTGKSASCRGDSGGPYVHVDPETNRYTQIGLVSYGKRGCAGKTFIGTNVPQWYKWIEKAVQATSPKGLNVKSYNVCRKID